TVSPGIVGRITPHPFPMVTRTMRSDGPVSRTRRRLSALGAFAVLAVAPGPALADDDPTITQPPVISGTAQVGLTLTATSGTWAGTEPMTAAYQWLRCSALTPSDCSAISGATGLSYTAVTEDEGYALRVSLTVTNAFGAASDQ